MWIMLNDIFEKQEAAEQFYAYLLRRSWSLCPTVNVDDVRWSEWKDKAEEWKYFLLLSLLFIGCLIVAVLI